MDAAKPANLSTTLALDSQGLSRLKKAAGTNASRADRDRAIDESARQVEAMFVDSLMKSMRATRMDSGLFQTPGRDMYEDMLDRQRSQVVSARGIGLAAVIARQLKSISDTAGGAADAPEPTQGKTPWSAASSISR